MSEMSQAALVALSEWIDAGNAHRDPEAVTWGRLAKVAEEGGEVVAAYIGATGQNPRKGQTHVIHDVVDELMDVAITALGAVEHLTGHEGTALAILDARIVAVASRAGLVTRPADPVRCPKCGAPHPFHDPACVVHPDLIQDHNEQEQR